MVFLIYIASDHAGFEFKKKIIEHFIKTKIEYTDLGTDSKDPVDYPYYAKKLSMELIKDKNNFGILICGTGIGMSIAANKIDGIRAALCKDEFCAKMSRMHNNANVLCLGERVTDENILINIVDTFLNTQFESGRHLKRINQISELEKIINKI